MAVTRKTQGYCPQHMILMTNIIDNINKKQIANLETSSKIRKYKGDKY